MLLKIAAILLGVLATVGVVSFFGTSGVLAILFSANLNIILIAALIQIIILLLTALRLSFIAGKYGSVPFRQVFKGSTVGIFAGMLSPLSRIGGEPFKVIALKGYLGGSESSAVILIDTISEVVSSLAILLAVILLFANILPGAMLSSFIIFLVMMTVIFLASVKIFLNRAILERVFIWAAKRLKRFGNMEKKDYAGMFLDSFKLLAKDRKILAGSLVISFAMKSLEFVRLWLIFLALGMAIPFSVIIIVWSVILTLLIVPGLPGSLGLVEFGGTSVLIMFGVKKASAASGIIMDRLISFWLVLFIGIIVIWLSEFKVINILKNQQAQIEMPLPGVSA